MSHHPSDASPSSCPTASECPAVASPQTDFPIDELLRTPRVRLRQPRYRDLLDLKTMGEDPRVSRLLLDEHIATLAEACALVEWSHRLSQDRPGLGVWCAENNDGTFIGFVSLTPERDSDDIVLGARLMPKYWGLGYALEGGAALCEHAFGTLGLPRLVSLFDPNNHSVLNLLARLGFTAEGNVMHGGRAALRYVLPREAWSGPRDLRTDDVSVQGGEAT